MIIITYHAVDDRPSPVSTTTALLRRDLMELGRAGYAFVSMDRCGEWLSGQQTLPDLSAAVTFDDGYASVVERALPVLTELKVPATVYAIAGRIGANNDWAGQWRSVPLMQLADARGLRMLAEAGVTIGAHTVTHPVLPALPADQARQEIQESGDRLEQVLGTQVRHFAYPYGAYGPRERELARERYDTASIAAPGKATRGSDRYGLPRLDAHDLRVALRLGVASWSALPAYLTARRTLRRLRRVLEGAR
jgi:peptidoglycan/xylan/chitin deacetylase (PgdA/CDA1 family)